MRQPTAVESLREAFLTTPLPRSDEERYEMAQIKAEYDAARDSYRELVRDILDMGGWGPDRYRDRESIPRVIRRKQGEAPDVLAALLGYDSPDEVLDDLERRYRKLMQMADEWRSVR